MNPRDALIHRPVLVALLAALKAIFGESARAEAVVEKTLRSNPRWGARDRRVFAESVYELVRWWRREAWRAGVAEDVAFGSALKSTDCAHIWGAWWTAQGRALPDVPELETISQECRSGGRSLDGAPGAVLASFPDWLDDVSLSLLGPAWSSLRAALNEPAEVWLRANTLRATPAEAVAALAREHIVAVPHGDPDLPQAIRLLTRRKLISSPSYKAGMFEIQDAGSQEIAPFLGACAGEVIIDSCAGGGGKSLHLAALMHNQGRIVAMDVHPWKLDALKVRARRAGASCIESIPLKPDHPVDSWKSVADRLLIDAPCSGLGVLRRRPDTKWKSSPAELERLRCLQASLLDAYERWVKPGGILVYATCSYLPVENEDQIRKFLARQPAGRWEMEEEKWLRPDPSVPRANHDAYYMARLRRHG